MPKMQRTVIVSEPNDARTRFNRYAVEGAVNPLRFAKNWNRTYEMIPEGEIRGGVLLMHGLTDSPYSVRAEAEVYAREGFYALALRMPGHGTIPGALTEARWEDWRAAARLGARAVRGAHRAEAAVPRRGLLERRRARRPVLARRPRRHRRCPAPTASSSCLR